MIPLPVVYDGVRNAELDIVSIPGLPTLSPRYKLKDHNQWLREVLSHQVPQARIMGFQYDFAKDHGEASWLSLLQQVEKLLYSLIHRREGVESRPIIFVCYSFGAFILKKALLISKDKLEFRNILEMTRGIVFLGCINDEGRLQFEDLTLKCAVVELGVSKKDKMVECLRKDADWIAIREVMENFRTLDCPFPVRILFELKPSSIGGRHYVVKKIRECLCSEQVSALGWKNERLIGVQKDHAEITMYPHRSDEDGFFEQFMSTLTEIVGDVTPQTAPSQQSSTDVVGGGQSGTARGGLASSGEASLAFESDDDVVSIIYGATPAHGPGNARIPCFVTTPYNENSHFIGRQDMLARIHDKLAPSRGNDPGQKTFALTGLGGMGKTQIAIHYAFQHRQTYKIVLLAHADGQSKLAESFSLFADQLGLGAGMSNANAKQAVKDCLELVAAGRVQAPCGSILITSRDHSLVKPYTGAELTEMAEDSAVDLLLQLTNFSESRLSEAERTEEETAARELVRRVGYLPLGISQAATLIVNDSCSLGEFLDAYTLRELVQDSADIRLASSGSSYRYSLRTVWNMNFESLSPDQQGLMKLMSFLDPDRVQLEVLRDGVDKSQDPSLGFIATPYKLAKCRAALLHSTLVSQSENGKELRMHRLVQASCQLRMTTQESQETFQSAITLIKAVWPVPPRVKVHNPSLWEEQCALLPHVQKLCQAYVNSCEQDKPLIPHDTVNWDFASVLYKAGWYCYERGLLESVSELLEPVKKYCLRHLTEGGGYRILADVYGGLGSLCTESNQFQGAYDNFSEQWKYLQLAFDNDELQRPSIWEVFGLARLGTACTACTGDRKLWITHLATCLWLQGRLDEGEQVVRPVIKDENDTSNFRTAMAMYSLGNIQIAQAGRLAQEGEKHEAETRLNQAMSTHSKVLHLWTITLGKKHHKTADAMHKVGWHLHRRQEYPRAMELFEKALDIYSSQPTIFKNEIARTKYKLGCLKQDMKHYAEGKALITEAESIRQTIVPPERWEPARGEEDFDEIVQFWTR